MEFLNKERNQDDWQVFSDICFDSLCLPIEKKNQSDEFCGIYFEGRNREINTIEDFAVLHSFKFYSEYNYPFFILSPNGDNILNKNERYKNSRIIHIKIPECKTHDEYSHFVIKNIWNFIPKQYERLLFFHPDGFLIKSGWEKFIIENKIDYVGAAWCHEPSIDILINNKWEKLQMPTIRCGNGGFSYRSRKYCEIISNIYSNCILRESGRTDNRFPPEDLFYSYFIKGLGGNISTIKQAMQFSLDPITLSEYENKLSFGFHCPKKVNEFQNIRNYYLNL